MNNQYHCHHYNYNEQDKFYTIKKQKKVAMNQSVSLWKETMRQYNLLLVLFSVNKQYF